MGAKVFKGDNADIKQISTHTVTGTWAADDTGTLTCGGKSVTFTVVAGSTAIADVVAGLVAAWNASEDGALEEVAASDASPAITLTAETAGVPFITSESETTAGDGAIGSQTDSTAVDGAAHWDQATNWDTGAVPVNDDDITIEATDNDIKYGLDQSSVTPDSLTFRQSFTGTCGLPRENNDGNNEFTEYRDTYLQISPDVCEIGAGEGDGSGRIKLDFGSIVCAATVLNTGSRTERDVPAILLKGTHASNTLTVLKGDVGVAFFAGETSTIATLNVAGSEAETQVVCGPGVSITTINQTGGTLDVDTTASAITTINLDGGTCILRGDTNGVTTINVAEGAKLIDMGGSGTIATLNLHGEYDHSQSMTARPITNRNFYPGYIYRDPHGVVAVGGNGIDFHYCGPGVNGTMDTKPNRTWTESAIA